MSEVTGLFTFKMKVNGEARPATVEITPPGIASEHVVRVVRGEWAALVVPRVSQNRIECLGYDRIESAPAGSKPARAIGPHPLLIFRSPT